MSRAPDLTSMDAVVETELITFDYGRAMVTGAFISAMTVSCTATKGIDPNPSSRLIGPPSIVSSPGSQQPNQAVTQLVGNTVAGEVYRLGCVAQTSDGQSLDLWTHMAAVDPN